MPAIGRVDLETRELPDALEFVVTRVTGWVELVLGAGLTIFVVGIFWRSGGAFAWIIAALAVFASLYLFLSIWIHRGKTRLLVTSKEISAEGNLHRWFSSKLHIPTAELKSLKWDSGGEGDRGLYARRAWSYDCVLPEISEQQAQSIRDAIANKFPHIRIDENSPVSILFGDESGITTLGIGAQPDTEGSPESPDSS